MQGRYFSAPAVRIVDKVDENRRITLRGNTHPLAVAANDIGAVPPGQPMRRMLLLLHRSQQQEAALDNLLTAQQNSFSAQYHQWLTPENFGASFGTADADVQTITDWLISHAFTGITLNKGRTVIEFSGTADQVQSAFRIAIHRYQERGAIHMANQSDPSIPAALAPVVAGVVSLNDFGRRSMAVHGPVLSVTKNQPHMHIVPETTAAGVNSQYTLPHPDSSTFYGVVPYDFATIYDLLPLWKAGLDGTGQTIAIVGETDINLNDAEQFRAFFGLPVNNPTVITAGADPGVQPDETEADLDVEWSGAVAKGAQVELVASASTETTAGVDLSALYIIDNNLAPVMSESYGECELFLGTTANAFEAALWQQAAAEGITALVSAGDQGSAACDPTDSNQNLAGHPMAVSGIASTPYNVAVGGTDFNQHNQWAQYWSDSNDPTTKQSVLGPIPEIPWNDSCGSTTLDAIYGDDPATACNNGTTGVLYLDTIAGSGGASTCISSDGIDATSCTGGWPKPAWQAGVGVPADGARDIPDVSLFASNGVYQSAYVVCEVDASGGLGCDPSAPGQTFLGVGGTSASAPAMAGVMAIINQKYGRQGNANFTLYRLAASPSGATIFHDITTDGNRVACNFESSDCVIPSGASEPVGTMRGHDSTVGYDMVTGLGSIDMANLVNNWQVGFTATTTTLSLNGGTTLVTAQHGSAVQAAVAVSALSGQPTGDISLLGATANGSMYLGTLQNGLLGGPVNALPGGAYAVTAHYAGDTQFAPSDSNPINVSISPEPSTTKESILDFDAATGTLVPAVSAAYGNIFLFRADVSGQSGYGFATGSVTFTDNGAPLAQLALNSQGSTESIPQNLFGGGNHTLAASYTGDPSFNSSAATSSLAITPAPTLCSLRPNTTYLRAGWDWVFNPGAILNEQVFAEALNLMVAPTGTVSIYSGSSLLAGPTTVTGAAGSVTSEPSGFAVVIIPTATIPQFTLQAAQVAALTAPPTVVYSGDENYASCTSSLPINYQTGPVASIFNIYIQTNNAYAGIPVGTVVEVYPMVTAVVPPPTGEPPYPAASGTLQIVVGQFPSGTPAPFGQVLLSAGSVAIPTANLSPGSYFAQLIYSGDSNYLPSTSPQIPFTLLSTARDFSITANPTTLVVQNGQTSSPGAIQITDANGFTGTVSFSCSGLPAGASCAFSPATVTNSGSTSLDIATTTFSAADRSITRNRPTSHSGWLNTDSISAAVLLLFLLPRSKRRGGRLYFIAICTIVLGVTCCGGGCGGGSAPIQAVATGTPPGVYTVTVNATSGTLSHSLSLTFVVN